MNFIKAENLVTDLKARYQDDVFFSDIYFSPQDMSLAEAEREYDVYIEYNGEFLIERVTQLIASFPQYVTALTMAFSTRQLIIW